jgi:hypothetical protein
LRFLPTFVLNELEEGSPVRLGWRAILRFGLAADQDALELTSSHEWPAIGLALDDQAQAGQMAALCRGHDQRGADFGDFCIGKKW